MFLRNLQKKYAESEMKKRVYIIHFISHQRKFSLELHWTCLNSL